MSPGLYSLVLQAAADHAAAKLWRMTNRRWISLGCSACDTQLRKGAPENRGRDWQTDVARLARQLTTFFRIVIRGR